MKPLIRKRRDCGWTCYFRDRYGHNRRESFRDYEYALEWVCRIIRTYRAYLTLPADYPPVKS